MIITDCGSAPSTCRFCQGAGGFDYMGYEGDYNLHKETEMYRRLHDPTQLDDSAKWPVFSNSEKSSDGHSVIENLLKDIDTNGRKKGSKKS